MIKARAKHSSTANDQANDYKGIESESLEDDKLDSLNKDDFEEINNLSLGLNSSTDVLSNVKNLPSLQSLEKGAIKNNVACRDSSSSESDIENKNNETCGESSSSESDIENYLKRPEDLNLNSTFFKCDKTAKSPAFTQIEKNIFENIEQLSDSQSDSYDEEQIGEVVNPVPKATFEQITNFCKKLEEAKVHVEKYEAKKRSEKNNEDIKELLTMGEKIDWDTPEIVSGVNSALLDQSMHSSEFESFSESEKEDWEEVEVTEQPTKPDIIPKNGVQISVQMPETIHKKKGVDLLAAMKRRLNRIKKENQVYIHRVHLLCWVAHGNYVNNMLNKEPLLAVALSILPSQHCYSPDGMDLKCLEAILDWYRRAFSNMEKITPKNMPLDTNLMVQFNQNQARNSKMYVYMFVCLLRALGIQCRLVLSLQVEPLKPPARELHTVSTKPNEEGKNSENVEGNDKNGGKNSNSKKDDKTEQGIVDEQSGKKSTKDHNKDPNKANEPKKPRKSNEGKHKKNDAKVNNKINTKSITNTTKIDENEKVEPSNPASELLTVSAKLNEEDPKNENSLNNKQDEIEEENVIENSDYKLVAETGNKGNNKKLKKVTEPKKPRKSNEVKAKTNDAKVNTKDNTKAVIDTKKVDKSNENGDQEVELSNPPISELHTVRIKSNKEDTQFTNINENNLNNEQDETETENVIENSKNKLIAKAANNDKKPIKRSEPKRPRKSNEVKKTNDAEVNINDNIKSESNTPKVDERSENGEREVERLKLPESVSAENINENILNKEDKEHEINHSENELVHKAGNKDGNKKPKKANDLKKPRKSNDAKVNTNSVMNTKIVHEPTENSEVEIAPNIEIKEYEIVESKNKKLKKANELKKPRKSNDAKVNSVTTKIVNECSGNSEVEIAPSTSEPNIEIKESEIVESMNKNASDRKSSNVKKQNKTEGNIKEGTTSIISTNRHNKGENSEQDENLGKNKVKFFDVLDNSYILPVAETIIGKDVSKQIRVVIHNLDEDVERNKNIDTEASISKRNNSKLQSTSLSDGVGKETGEEIDRRKENQEGTKKGKQTRSRKNGSEKIPSQESQKNETIVHPQEDSAKTKTLVHHPEDSVEIEQKAHIPVVFETIETIVHPPEDLIKIESIVHPPEDYENTIIHPIEEAMKFEIKVHPSVDSESNKYTLKIPAIIDDLDMSRGSWRRSKSHSPVGLKVKEEQVDGVGRSASSSDLVEEGKAQKKAAKNGAVRKPRVKKNVYRMPIKQKTKSVNVPQVDGVVDYSSEEYYTDESDHSMLEVTQLDGTNDDDPLSSTDKQLSESKSEKNKTNRVKKSVLDRKVFSADGDSSKEKVKKKGVDIWVEIFLEGEDKWISADVVNGQVDCVRDIFSRASQPISYVLAWDNTNHIKDVTKRYCCNFNTVTRKLRTDQKWWGTSLAPFIGRKTPRDKKEDADLAKQHLDEPLPKSIAEYKDHPLYVLPRHLLKFQAIYPPDAVTFGFIRNEPVYSRDCVYTLHSREIWLKEAKVVKLGEKPYKIVKARPKWDKLSNTVIKDQLLDIFGPWQIEDYTPPTAENGNVPRNAYGNVELFKPSMLPKGTVHLQLPGLNKVARKLRIDCAPAVIGFDFHSGWSHPTFDGFVVCEEFSEQLIAAWYQDQEEQEVREEEKYEKRVYGNWKRLIKGLLIRERLKVRYDFGPEVKCVPIPKETEVKPKAPRFIINKKKK